MLSDRLVKLELLALIGSLDDDESRHGNSLPTVLSTGLRANEILGVRVWLP